MRESQKPAKMLASLVAQIPGMARDKPEPCPSFSKCYHYEPAHEGINLSFAFPSEKEKNP